MKKPIFFLLLFCTAASYCPAQGSNDMTARFKFQDAQTAFDNGDYATTLTKLNEAQKLLGSANPKILYLRIMAEYRSLDFVHVYGNIPLLQALKKNAAVYMQTYAASAADKARDIYEIDEEMKQYSNNPDTYAGIKALKNNDYATAANYFTKAANAGDAEAMNGLGWVADHKKEELQAMQWYQKAADKGNTKAMNNIGRKYEYGDGVPQDYTQALQWFKKAADKGNSNAMEHLGELYIDGLNGIARDKAKGMQYLQKAADKGNVGAMLNIGNRYRGGVGVPQDNAQAEAWFKKADEADKTGRAAWNIGVIFNYEGDYTQAMEWFQKAMDKGNADAMSSIGELYEYGKGVTQDYNQAVQWYKKAADKGSWSDMINIGVLYFDGKGVPQDSVKAEEWFEKAEAANTNIQKPDSTFFIGRAFFYRKDFTQAMKWWQKAADEGNTGAMESIGGMYENGKGVEKNVNTAIAWYRKAGDKDALKRLGVQE